MKIPRMLAAGFAALLVIMSMLGARPAAAVAGSVVKSVAVLNYAQPGYQLLVSQSLDVVIQIDSAPAPVKVDQFFVVRAPEEIQMTAGTFDLKDDAGVVLAACMADALKVRCTFNEAAAGRETVQGSLKVRAFAIKQTTANDVNFVVDGTTLPVDLPAGKPIGPKPPWPYPTSPYMRGYLGEADGTITWFVAFPASMVQRGEKIVIEQEIGEDGDRLLDPTTFRSSGFNSQADWNAELFRYQPLEVTGPDYVSSALFFNVPGAAPYTLSVAPDGRSFRFEVTADAPQEDSAYRLYFETRVPAGTPANTWFRSEGRSTVWARTSL